MRRKLFFLVLALVLPALGARAEEYRQMCKTQYLNTIQRSDCWKQKKEEAYKSLDNVYAKVLSARRQADIDFPEISAALVKSQTNWMSYVNAQCAFEADDTEGTAYAFAGDACQIRFYIERKVYLEGILKEWTEFNDKSKNEE